MKVITEYSHHKMNFKLLKRIGDVAIYKCGVTFEVVVVQTHKKDLVMAGTKIASAGDEYIPSASQFGHLGWAISNESLAWAKFKEVSEKFNSHD